VLPHAPDAWYVPDSVKTGYDEPLLHTMCVDKALARVMTAVLRDDTELFKQFMDNESFRRWLTDTVFGLTYTASGAGGLASR
jgi:hypothetical protein